MGPGKDPDKSAKLTVDVDGGDFQSASVSGPPVRTRGKITHRTGKDRTSGEDVAKLEVYLSQIPALDGRPCYRFGGYTKGGTLADFNFKPKTKPYVDGVFTLQLAKALWRFLYRYVGDGQFDVDSVDITRDPAPPPKKGAAPPPAPPSSITKDDLKKGLDVSTRVGDACTEYPVVTIKLVNEIVKRFRAPYVLPHVHVAVARDDKLTDEAGKRGFVLAESWSATDETKSAILPIDGDSVDLVLTAPAVQSVDGKLSVKLKLASGSAYSFDDGSAERTLDLTFGAGKTLPRVTLKSTKKVSPAAADNLLHITAKSGDVEVELGTLQLFGSRDLTKVAKDGKPRRDAAWVSVLLASQVDKDGHYLYHPVPKGGTAVQLDGGWNDARKSALAAVKTARSAADVTDLINKMKASNTP